MKTTLLIALGTIQIAAASPQTGQSYVAHEWGTFTSVQGADGVPLEWNPLTSSELPRFVHDWTKPLGEPRHHLTGFGGKTGFSTLQRLETPVIYFYSDKPQTVDVTVKFPQGLVTEWYPQISEIGPSAVQPRQALVKLDQWVASTGAQPPWNFASLDTRQGIPDSHIRWTEVRIQPAGKPGTISPSLPEDKTASHYYAARETDADLLAVHAEDKGQTVTEHERFLFYRGIGSFATPLQVRAGDEPGAVRIRNGGDSVLKDLFVLQVSPEKSVSACVYLARLTPGEERSVTVGTEKGSGNADGLLEQVSQGMAAALTHAGLYSREAKAMVKTWRDSWFAEPGTRVMYILPRPWTDQVLPLTLNPAPHELVRVMVGRAELVTPATERAVVEQVMRFSQADEKDRLEAVEAIRRIGLGRFLEPTLHLVAKKLPDPALAKTTSELLQAAMPPQPGNRSLALQ